MRPMTGGLLTLIQPTAAALTLGFVVYCLQRYVDALPRDPIPPKPKKFSRH